MTDLTDPLTYPFASPPTIYHPSPELNELRENRPVAPVIMPDGSTAWLVSRYADVRRVLSDPVFSRSAAVGDDAPPPELGVLESTSLIGQDPPVHTRLRRLVARVFTPRRVEELRPRVATYIDGLLDAMEARPRPVDLLANFSVPLPLWVISELFGIPDELRDECKTWSDAMLTDWREDHDGTKAALDAVSDMLALKRTRPGPDLLTDLISLSDDEDKLTAEELLGLVVGVLIGGHETTTNQIGMFLLTLLRFPEELARLRADPTAIAPAVEELTRFIQLGDTGIMLPRVTTEEVELSGVLIPAGAAVLPAFVAANRDPRAFAEPDQLDLRRVDNPHLGFGAGVHFCLGAQLARMELQESLRGLLLRFPHLRLGVPESDLRFKQGLAVRSLAELPVTW